MKKISAILFIAAVLLPAAITTLDGVVAGMQPPEEFLKVGATMEAAGVMNSLFYYSGRPGAATANGQAIAGVALTTGCATCAGQIPFVNPVSGNAYLARFVGSSTGAGTLMLLDRLWHNDSIAETTTTGQTVTSATWPARDRDGTTNGEGVMIAIEVSTATTNAGAVTNTTLTYTNQAGTGSRTGTISSFPATSVAGTFVPFQLAAGDTGVRSIQTLTLGTSYGGGTIHLVAYRMIARIDCPVANIGSAVDALTSGMPRFYSGSVPFLVWIPSSTTAVTVTGQVIYTHG